VKKKRTYKQAKADFNQLYDIAELDDCVEIDAQVFEFMANPTKKFAKSMYQSCIEMWFFEHGVLAGSEEILERWGLIDLIECEEKQ
jgi:hypothetical protein